MLKIVSQLTHENKWGGKDHEIMIEDDETGDVIKILIPADLDYWNFEEPYGLNCVTNGHYM